VLLLALGAVWFASTGQPRPAPQVPRTEIPDALTPLAEPDLEATDSGTAPSNVTGRAEPTQRAAVPTPRTQANARKPTPRTDLIEGDRLVFSSFAR
jgi:hypothetical protein